MPRPLLIKMSYWVRPLLSFYLRGHKITDPIDGKSFKKFLPYGYQNQRKNALSPSTLSLERHRLLWLYLQRKTDFFTRDIKLLHIAPEQCFYKRFKQQKNLQYTTADLHSPLADIKADICDLPFKDESFDVVFCNHVLEHIPDDAKALSELFRVLKKNGWGIFQVPQDLSRKTTYEDSSIISPQERAQHFGQYDHLRVYGTDYFERIAEIGFIVNPLKCSEITTKQEVLKYGLDPKEILPVCRKINSFAGVFD